MQNYDTRTNYNWNDIEIPIPLEGLLDSKADGLESSATVDELLYLNDLKRRKIFLNDDITQYTIEDTIKNILRINIEDSGIATKDRRPIVLYITSAGGDIAAGLGLIDVIMSSKTPIYTVNIGFQYSMGFLIGLAGHKRYATPNATFLLHDGSSVIYDSSTKAQDRMKFNNTIARRIKGLVLSRGKMSSKEYDRKQRVEWYMFSDEAKHYGFTDYIIGKDCDIDEILK